MGTTSNEEKKMHILPENNPKNSSYKLINRILSMRKNLPLLRGFFHFIIFLENPFQAFIAVNMCKTLESKLTCMAIFLSIQIHVTSSSLLHIVNWPLPYKHYIRLFDHSGIFMYSAIGHSSVWHYILKYNIYSLILMLQLSFMILGVLYTSFIGIHKLGRGLRCLLYLCLGFPIVPALYHFYINKLYELVATISLSLFIAVVASMVYSNKLPVLFPNVIEYHEIFHLLGYLAYKQGLKINRILLSF